MNNEHIKLDYWFKDTIIDNNGISVTDINLGLQNLFTDVFLENIDSYIESELFMVTSINEAYPDLVAKQSITGSQDYWWWFLLCNRLEDPFTEIKINWVYSILSRTQIQNMSDIKEKTNGLVNSEFKYGEIVELN